MKEIYFYLTNTPQHSYMKARYIYPVSAFPYDELIDVNSQRSRSEPEYELWDTGKFFSMKMKYFEISKNIYHFFYRSIKSWLVGDRYCLREDRSRRYHVFYHLSQ